MSTINDSSLGRLQRVELRDIWTSEPAGFTPWLAEPENLKILSDTLGFELELDSMEKEVGAFWADIVCRDISTDSLVLIENQLEQTDHTHLGQLLTYAAGLQAVTVVWLAARFRDEHRAALDWLNEITHQDSRFFGLEIELWKISNSPAAPKFNIISMPNDWSRTVAQASRSAGDTELQLLQRKYWAGLYDKLNGENGPVLGGNRKASARSWISFGMGCRGIFLDAVRNSVKKFIRVEVYITGEDAEERLGLLKQKKDEIEQELDYQLKWGDQLPTSRDRRISYYLHDTDPKDESDWPRQHEWLAEHLNKMHRVFTQRVKDL